jgi:flagellum-specific peptidoglycan hydrolase FlgJ
MRKLLLILSLYWASGLAGYCPEYHRLLIEKVNPIIFIDFDEIRLLLKEYKIMYPHIIEAQIKLETGYLKSELCKQNRNLFGMKYTNLRETTANGELNNHALYASFRKSILDYKIWQRLYYKGGDYYEFLSRIGYAEDKEYINKLKSI